MFSLNGLAENSFVQPTSPQTESVFIIQRRHSGSEIREAAFVSEKVAGMELEIELENVTVGNVKHYFLQMGIYRLFHLLCLL